MASHADNGRMKYTHTALSSPPWLTVSPCPSPSNPSGSGRRSPRLLVAAGQHVAAVASPQLRLGDVYGLNVHSSLKVFREIDGEVIVYCDAIAVPNRTPLLHHAPAIGKVDRA